jgi:hypothetical protein
MKDYLASVEKLRKGAAEAALIRDVATDTAKRDVFGRLHEHLSRLADEVERAVSNADLAGQPTKGYRAYLIDPSGRILGRTDLASADEEAAAKEAKQLVDGHDVELWEMDRKIATFRRGEYW